MERYNILHEPTKEELFSIWQECVTLTLEEAHSIYSMKKRKEYLEKHNHKVWEGADGRHYTYFDDSSAKRGIRRKGRSSLEQLEEVIIRHYYEEEQEPTFERVFHMWNDERLELKEIKKGTFDRLANDFKRFFVANKWDCNKQKIKSISEEDLERFIKTRIRDFELTSKAYGNMRTIILGVFRYAKRKRFTSLSITTFFGDLDLSRSSFTKKAVNDKNEVFDEEETEVLIEHLKQQDSVRDYAILLGLITGLTVGEIAALKPDELHSNWVEVNGIEETYKDCETKKRITERRDFPKTQKRVRTILIPNNFTYVTEKLQSLSGKDYLFEDEKGNRIKANAHQKRLRQTCKALGIPQKSWHKLRKTYGSALVDAGASESTITTQMGHKDIRTTKECYYRSRKSKEVQQAEVNDLYKRA